MGTTDKKRARVSPYRSEQRTTDVSGAIADAMSEFQALRDEMAETRDNMSAANMEHLPKYETAESAHDTLDGFADNEPDVPEAAEGLAVVWTAQVNRRKGRGESRAVRFDNAVALLQGAADALEAQIDNLSGVVDDEQGEAERLERDAEDLRVDAEAARLDNPPDEDAAADHEAEADDKDTEAEAAKERAADADSDKDALETLKDELDNIISEAESGVEFPGMYG